MLKPTKKKDCCWHNVSQHCSAPAIRCQLEARRNAVTAATHTPCDVVDLGEAYYARLSQLIDRHLELGTSDRVCYIGDPAGAAQVVPILTQNYCLVQPVTQVNPYPSSPDGTCQHMNEVFSYQPEGLRSQLYFDKIVIYNSIHLFPDITTELLHLINALTDRGRLLIIHRPFRLNTLPFPTDVLNRFRSSDLSLEHLISTIQLLGLEFQWEVDNSKVVTSRQKWLDMVQCGKFPPFQHDKSQAVDNPDKTSNVTSDGVHELMTGVLRYAGDSEIEIVDRMVFVTIYRTPPVPATKKLPTVTRSLKSSNRVGRFGPLEMEVTPEIKELLNAKHQSQLKKCSLFD